mmetsp:Transcript_13384/g.26940  ORF Transcript_13384/g.26940 Transcript_13384/m.26940 type:complete len:172 (-) Transcript_13384:193-708(-)
MAICGKILTGVVFSSPGLKRSFLVYVPAPLLFCLSHFIILDVSLADLCLGQLGDAVHFATDTARLQVFCAVVGFAYGFVASLLHLLVREFFGLRDLSKLQPIVFGAMIVGEMCGMALPGVLADVYKSYVPSMLISLASTIVTMACFAVLYCEHPLGPRRSTSSSKNDSLLL